MSTIHDVYVSSCIQIANKEPVRHFSPSLAFRELHHTVSLESEAKGNNFTMKSAWIRLISLCGAANACLLPWELEGQSVPENVKRQAAGTTPAPIGEGNRWENGEIPRGLGTQPRNASISSIMTPTEIRAAVEALIAEFDLELIETPEETHEGATMFGAKLGTADCSGSYRTLLTAGIHARERGGPDNLVYFIADILWAKREGTGVSYGGRSFTEEEVDKALQAGIIFMPMLNPDGIAHDQAESDCWRKNRNPDGAVDLNRNFDILWDYRTKFVEGVGVSVASDNPMHETYHGAEPFSEPESRNVKWIMDEYPTISWTLDIHSFAGLVLYSWGDDYNQASDPEMNFLNTAYDGKRGLAVDQPGQEYRAYMPLDVWRNNSFVALRVADAMNSAVDGRHVEATQAVSLYPSSGSLSDWMSARHMIDEANGVTHGFTIEFGRQAGGRCPFYSDIGAFNDNIRQVGAGLMELLVAAADTGLGDLSCDAAPIRAGILSESTEGIGSKTCSGNWWLGLVAGVVGLLVL